MTFCLAPCRRRTARRGYTLIELLVVLTVISILVTLVTVASVGFIASARVAATRSTIKRVDEAILERVAAVNRWHQRPVSRLEHDWEFRGWRHRWEAHGLDVFASTASRNDARLVLSRKGMLLELLPVDVEELKLAYWFWARFDDPSIPSVIMINKVPVPYLSAPEVKDMEDWLADIDENPANNTPGGDAPGKPSALDRPGEVFFYALTNAPVFGGQRVREEDFKSGELIDPDQDGIYELGDAWEQPLRFYRWPTRLVNDGKGPADDWSDNVARNTLMPNALSAALDLKVDPDDRADYLALPHPLHKVPLAAFFHDPNTWHAPLIVSAGPDGNLGISEPNEPESASPAPGFIPPRIGLAIPDPAPEAVEALYDNITNHAGQAGGL